MTNSPHQLNLLHGLTGAAKQAGRAFDSFAESISKASNRWAHFRANNEADLASRFVESLETRIEVLRYSRTDMEMLEKSMVDAMAVPGHLLDGELSTVPIGRYRFEPCSQRAKLDYKSLRVTRPVVNRTELVRSLKSALIALDMAEYRKTKGKQPRYVLVHKGVKSC